MLDKRQAHSLPNWGGGGGGGVTISHARTLLTTAAYVVEPSTKVL